MYMENEDNYYDGRYLCASCMKDNISIVWICLREHNMAGDKPLHIRVAI